MVHLFWLPLLEIVLTCISILLIGAAVYGIARKVGC
jgi:hypothetical protein